MKKFFKQVFWGGFTPPPIISNGDDFYELLEEPPEDKGFFYEKVEEMQGTVDNPFVDVTLYIHATGDLKTGEKYLIFSYREKDYRQPIREALWYRKYIPPHLQGKH